MKTLKSFIHRHCIEPYRKFVNAAFSKRVLPGKSPEPLHNSDRRSDIRSRFELCNLPIDSVLLECQDHPWIVVVSIQEEKPVRP